MSNVLVIAFDGLDKDLIEQFGCDNLVMHEYGAIENDDGICKRKTSELFTTFITGETHEVHGVEGLTHWSNEKIDKFEEKYSESRLFKKWEGLRYSIYESIRRLDAKKKFYDKDNYEVDTLFEEIDNSRAMFVPGYNPSSLFRLLIQMKLLDKGYSRNEVADIWKRKEFRDRKDQLQKELENEIISPRNFLMCHFHYTDVFHHMYGDKSIDRYQQDKLRKMYQEIDKYAGELKELAEKTGYDTIIFMSDHGLPQGKSHNKKAFYSCNKSLFWDRTPLMTDFYSKISEMAG